MCLGDGDFDLLQLLDRENLLLDVVYRLLDRLYRGRRHVVGGSVLCVRKYSRVCLVGFVGLLDCECLEFTTAR